VQRELDKIWQTTSFIDCNYTRFLDRVHNCGVNRPELGGAYTYRISAVDDEGNESAQSEPLAVQLYDTAGSAVEEYDDIYLDGNDRFPFDTDFSTTDNFLTDFQLVFADEFNGDSLDASKWNTSMTWGQEVEVINGEQQYFVDILNNPDFGYDPFKFNGSTMTIEAIQTPAGLSEAALGQPFLSGTLSSHDKFGFTYGYAEGRIKAGGVSGQLTSFYLLRRWAAEHSPEIDIVEYLGENPFGDEDAFQTYHFHDVVHGTTRSSPTMAVKKDAGLFADEFHTYGVLWEPSLVIWYIDGQEVKRLSGPQISRQSMNIVFQQVTGSEWAPFPTSDPAAYPLSIEVDYIRVYQREPYVR
jgi:beta-glucanase (GH16 family)